MTDYLFSDYQKGQLKVINDIEQQVTADNLNFSVVTPTADFKEDSRIALTGVHFPHADLKEFILSNIQKPLREIQPEHYYYPEDALHLTIKNVRVTNDPPHFSAEDITKAIAVFANIVPNHKKFKAYFFRLFLFKYNLALVGTTDPELDSLTLHLDRELNQAGVPDDKKYANDSHFFAMTTVVRFTSDISEEYRNKIAEISNAISFPAYTFDRISLITCNAVLSKKTILGEWNLQ